MEVIWKAALEVIHFQIGLEVDFHNMIHGFKAGRRTGTASLKAKLLHHLKVMMEDFLYKVLLYI